MMKTLRLKLGWLLLLTGLALSPAAAKKNNAKGDDILKRVDRNLNPVDYESYRKIINIEPNGDKKTFVLYAAKKGTDKMVTTFLSPQSEVGRSTLRLGDNMWLYIPNVGKPVRITSLQSVIGGIFNNSDIMRLDYHVEYYCSALKTEGNAYVLTCKAKHQAVAYDKLMMRINRAALLPLEIGCYTASGMLIKTLRFLKIKKMGHGHRRPSVIETTSPLHKGYKAIIIFAKLRERKFANAVFTIDYMSKIKDLRR